MIQVDISNIWGEISLPDLLELEQAVEKTLRFVPQELRSNPGTAGAGLQSLFL